MAVYCINSTVGPESICPILCVFGAIPSPARRTPATLQVARAAAIDDAIKVVDKEHIKRKLQLSKSYRGPYGKESKVLDSLPFGSRVLVFRD